MDYNDDGIGYDDDNKKVAFIHPIILTIKLSGILHCEEVYQFSCPSFLQVM
jgi:hypothetical protein